MQRLSRESDSEGGDRVAMALPAEEVAALGPAEAYWDDQMGELVFRGRRVRLTPREWEVLVQIGQAMTNRQIAHALGISPATVAFHVGNLLRKVGVASRVELALIARRVE